MPQAYLDVQEWSGGVITAQSRDEIPQNASPHALNASLSSVEGRLGIPSKRLGMKCLNRTQIGTATTIHGAYEFIFVRGDGVLRRYHLIVSDDGRLDSISSTGTTKALSVSAFTAGDYIPDFTTAQNLCFIANGQDAVKLFDGLTLGLAGITRPTVGTMAGTAGAAGTPNGTYELRVTYRNSKTGHESSVSDTATSTVTLSSETLDLTNIPVSSEARVDQRRIWVRNTSTMAYFFLVHTISDNTSTTASSVDWTDSSLITRAPDTSENDPPGAHRYLEWHRNRLYAAGVSSAPSQVFYSKLGKPEAFDPDNFERINELDGEPITALYSMQDMLLVFKRTSLWAIIGDNPSTWQVRQLSNDTGCLSHRSIVAIEGSLYWWSEHGPVQWSGSGGIESIGMDLLYPEFVGTVMNDSQRERIAAGVKQGEGEVLFAVPSSQSTVLDLIYIWNHRLGRWSGVWDPMDIGTFSTARDTNGYPRLYLHNLKGQVFQMGMGLIDGVCTGTVSGTFTAGATSISSITGQSGFDTTGGGLVERKVTILDSNGAQVGTFRPKIASNTASVLTFDRTLHGLTNGSTYTFVVGAPNFVWETKAFDHDLPFHKKRYEFIYLGAESSSANNHWLDIEVDYTSGTQKTKTLTFAYPVIAAEWGVSNWDAVNWDDVTTSNIPRRYRVGMRGHTIRCRIRSPYPNETFVLRKFGIRAMVATDRREDLQTS